MNNPMSTSEIVNLAKEEMSQYRRVSKKTVQLLIAALQAQGAEPVGMVSSDTSIAVMTKELPPHTDLFAAPPAQAAAVPDWEAEAKRAFWCGLEIGASMGAVAIAPRWDEYIEKRKAEIKTTPSPALSLDDVLREVAPKEIADALAPAPAEKAEAWQTVDEFQSEANEGWCWIVYKGRVTEAYHDHRGYFMFSKHSTNCYMSECISAVMPWPYPAAPVNGEGE